jgi:Ser/Thr protein kinase RdoA (MazF antagonist)
MDGALSGELRAVLQRRYGVRLKGGIRVHGGEESDVWRVESDRGQLAVVISPSWRTLEEMEWVHGLTRFVAAEIPQVVPPLLAEDGTTLIEMDDRLVAAFPWMTGGCLDREDLVLREGAARLLARLHITMTTVPMGRRPEPGSDAPVRWPGPADPPEMTDPTLDELLAEVEAGKWRLARGAIHGDYYGRNVVSRDGRIVGVVDWNESTIAFPMQELAWSTWEFAHGGMGDTLTPDHARSFIRGYESGVSDAST